MPSDRRGVLAGLLGLAATGAAAQQSAAIAVPAAYPFSRLRAGVPQGLIAEPVAAALVSAGLTARYFQLTIPNIYRAVESGQIAGGMVMTPLGERGGRAAYTLPILTEYSVLITSRARAPAIRTLDDLRGLRIAGRDGFVYASLDAPLDGALLRRRTDAQNIRDLLLGRIDAAIIGGVKVMRELRAEGVLGDLVNTRLAVGGVGLGAAFARGSAPAARLPAINAALAAYLADERWPALLARHGAVDLIRPYPLL